MENTLKNTLFKRLILIENLLILAISIVSAILCLFGNITGFTVLLYSSYILYPLILITFAVAFIMKSVTFREFKLNLSLFILNLPVSILSAAIGLSKAAAALESF